MRALIRFCVILTIMSDLATWGFAVSDAVFEAVVRCVSAELEVDPERVTPTAHLADQLDATSLDLVELVMSLEDQFGIRIPGEATMSVETVGDLVALIHRLS
jgi:acyl carrier protein